MPEHTRQGRLPEHTRQGRLSEFLDERLPDVEFREAWEDAAALDTLRANLILSREKSGLRQEDLAAKIRTTQSAISDLELGKTDPRLSTLQRYARGCGWEIVVHLVREDATELLSLPCSNRWAIWKLTEEFPLIFSGEDSTRTRSGIDFDSDDFWLGGEVDLYRRPTGPSATEQELAS